MFGLVPVRGNIEKVPRDIRNANHGKFENFEQQKEHQQVPKRGWKQVPGRVEILCLHVTPVAIAQWKPLFIR